jgi:hypothetical protein
MTGKKTVRKTKQSTMIANNPDDRKGRLKTVGGSPSDDWNNVLANQTIQALWVSNSDPETEKRQRNATIAALVGIGPKNELEGMMAARMST